MSKYNTPALRIAATIAGIWRAGVQHPAEPVVHPAGTFTGEQIELLESDPALIVDVLDGDGAAAGSAAPVDAAFAAITALDVEQLAELHRRLDGDQDFLARVEQAADLARGDTNDPAADRGGGGAAAAADASLQPAVMEALDRLAPTKKPTVRALEEASGADLDAASRDAHWDAWQAARDGA